MFGGEGTARLRDTLQGVYQLGQRATRRLLSYGTGN